MVEILLVKWGHFMNYEFDFNLGHTSFSDNGNNTLRLCNSNVEKLINQKFPIGNRGFIKVVDYMGDDRSVCQAARVSYGSGTKTVREDKGLINYLIKHGHWSPFEMVYIKFHIKMPIFVARQWIRHRTANVNEYSARYSELTDDVYIPSSDEIGKASKTNKQATDIESFSDEEKSFVQNHIEEVSDFINKEYHNLLEKGVSREVSRVIKPVGGYTEWYYTINLRDLIHFIRQRSDSHAQPAIRKYSDYLRDAVLKNWCPWSYESFLNHVQNSVTLSSDQVNFLGELFARFGQEFFNADSMPVFSNISKKEMIEVIKLLKTGKTQNNEIGGPISTIDLSQL